MPELSSVQTYEQVNADNFGDVLACFSKVLKAIGIWHTEVENAFRAVEWGDDEYFFPIVELGYFKSNLFGFEIRPLVFVFKEKEGNWMTCDLLMDSNALYQMHKDDFRSLIKTIAQEMFDQHKTPTYFTDEAQDGQPLEGIRNNIRSKLWEFDYAIIPSNLAHLYAGPPTDYIVKDCGNYLEAWQLGRWSSIF